MSKRCNSSVQYCKIPCSCSKKDFFSLSFIKYPKIYVYLAKFFPLITVFKASPIKYNSEIGKFL